MGIGFKQFGLESDVVFEGNYGSVWTYLSFQFQMKKKERYVNSKWICWSSNLGNFRSENGCGKWHFLVWHRVMIWRNRGHTPTKNSQEQTPYPGEILILFYLVLAGAGGTTPIAPSTFFVYLWSTDLWHHIRLQSCCSVLVRSTKMDARCYLVSSLFYPTG